MSPSSMFMIQRPASAAEAARLRRSSLSLTEDEMPTTWYNLVADLPEPPPPPLHPGTQQPIGPADLAPLFPMGSSSRRSRPSGTSTSPARCWTSTGSGGPAALPGSPAREGARDPGPDLLQVRGCFPGRLAQAEHVRAAGLLQRPGGREEAHDRDRRWPMGHGAGFRLPLFDMECEVWQVGASFDQKPYRRTMMEAFGASVHRSPSTSPSPAGPSWPPTRTTRARWASRSPRRSRWPRRTRTPSTPWARCSTTCCCTRRSSARRRSCSSRWRARTHDLCRLHRRRLQLRRAGVPVPAGEDGRADQPGDPRRRARVLPVADPRDYAYDFGDTAGSPR